MHPGPEMANQNGRARNADLPSVRRDEDRDRDRYGSMRDDDRPVDQRFYGGGADRFEDRRREGRDERFSESDRRREPYAGRDREARGERGDLRGHRTPVEAMPRQDQLLRGAYRDHDESSCDLSHRADRLYGEPYGQPRGPIDERVWEVRGGAGPTGAAARERMPPSRGPHHGKGPAGFQRSDERIHELVCEALTYDGEIDATHLEVSVKDGEVTLIGTIEDRRMKRLAEDCVEAVPGVTDVHNQLRIGEPPDTKHRPS